MNTTTTKTATITFNDEIDMTYNGSWIYEILLDNKSLLSIEADPACTPEDCIRCRDFEQLDNMETIFKKIVELTKQGYEIEYKYKSKCE